MHFPQYEVHGSWWPRFLVRILLVFFFFLFMSNRVLQESFHFLMKSKFHRRLHDFLFFVLFFLFIFFFFCEYWFFTSRAVVLDVSSSQLINISRRNFRKSSLFYLSCGIFCIHAVFKKSVFLNMLQAARIFSPFASQRKFQSFCLFRFSHLFSVQIYF